MSRSRAEDDAPTAAKHPAPFTESIIEELALLIPACAPSRWVGVHDPFAGEGRRLGALCDKLGYKFTGTDLEPWKDRDSRVRVGDSTDPTTYPTGPFIVATSPTYNNGVNDHFLPRETSRRLTYRVAAGRPLHVNNTGRYSGRGSKKGEVAYWELTRKVVAHWPGTCLVNVKDSTRAGTTYPLVDLWTALLCEFEYDVRRVEVECPGWRFGTNHEKRAEVEAILVAYKNTDALVCSVASGVHTELDDRAVDQ